MSAKQAPNRKIMFATVAIDVLLIIAGLLICFGLMPDSVPVLGGLPPLVGAIMAGFFTLGLGASLLAGRVIARAGRE